MQAVIAGMGCTDEQKLQGTDWQIGEAANLFAAE
jgi:hypothetical protein